MGSQSNLTSSGCSLQVLYQFLQHPIDTREDMLEAYLVGTRLCKFLSAVLPKHPDYFSMDRELENSRERSQTQLIELLQYVEEIALIIDGDENRRGRWRTRQAAPARLSKGVKLQASPR